MSDSSAEDSLALESLVAGVADDFLERQRKGEQPDVEEYVARHPQAATLLRRVLASLEVIGLSQSGCFELSAAAEEGPDALPTGQLGDFRIVRELGKGGMGIVYEAEQISLGRRVALKLLPLAGALDARRLQRFRHEAQAAAHLHHSNIVPVFFVGSDHGVHYYAMQLIDGQTLADVIALLRQERSPRPARPQPAAAGPEDHGPTSPYLMPESCIEPREAIVRAPGDTRRQAAGSLSTAGDIRSAAFFRMVAQLGVQAAEALDHAHQQGIVHRDIKPANLMLDGKGSLWVTDFGLAQMHSDAQLTQTGDLVGTLRYMSPEQALSQRMTVDHRTDIYSLGVTLYELLTLSPPFAGNDRQELLRQIAFDEPQALRKRNKAVPGELETVVLKAMEKNPADRYSTAQELADDLRHWLEDKPIHARRPTLVQRTRRWVRRHQALFSAIVAVGLITVVLAGSTGMWWHLQQLALEAEVGRALGESTERQKQGKYPEALSAAQRATGLLAGGTVSSALRQRAQQRLHDLTMVHQLDEILLQYIGGKGSLEDRTTDRAYGNAFREYGIDPERPGYEEAAARIHATTIPAELIAALKGWAAICRRTRPKDDALAERLLQIAQAADPDWAAREDRLAAALDRRDARAVEELTRAEDMAVLPSINVWRVAVTLRAGGAGEQAVQLLRQAQEHHPEDFRISFELAYTLENRQPPQWEEAARYYTAAVALRPHSMGAWMNVGRALYEKRDLEGARRCYQMALAIDPDAALVHDNLGITLGMMGRLDEAVHEFQEAIRLKPDFPEAYHNLGIALDTKGRVEEAMDAYRKTIELQNDNAPAHNNLGNALMSKGRVDEAIPEFREAIRLQGDYDLAHSNLGLALLQKGRPDEAIPELRAALQLNGHFAKAHYNLGMALSAKGQLDEAMKEFREAIRIDGNYADAHYNLGNKLDARGQIDEAIDEYRKAIRLNEKYAEAHCNLGQLLLRQGKLREAVEELRRGHELGSQNPRWPYPSAQWLRNAERIADLDTRLPALVKGQEQPKDAGECLALAQFCQAHRKQHAAAVRFYGQAFDRQKNLTGLRQGQHRYNAACSAALAGCGEGEDAPAEDAERARLRQQALDWLRADLKAYRQVMEKTAGKAGPEIAQRMQHWLQDEDFVGVRGDKALVKLPEGERKDWQKLWEEVEVVRKQAAQQPKTARSARP